MKAEAKAVIRLNLELTPEEAEWLHGQMQNPLHGQSSDQEMPSDKEMRHRFFSVTDLPRHMAAGIRQKSPNLFGDNQE